MCVCVCVHVCVCARTCACVYACMRERVMINIEGPRPEIDLKTSGPHGEHAKHYTNRDRCMLVCFIYIIKVDFNIFKFKQAQLKQKLLFAQPSPVYGSPIVGKDRILNICDFEGQVILTCARHTPSLIASFIGVT